MQVLGTHQPGDFFRIMDFLRDSVKQAVSSVWWLFVYVHELVSLLSELAAI